ncbi:DUF3536 domain-containing protein, partial [candidate division GN15 bacterium]|nr:DUF3536 domain-containing protein [candidate division GN15 bacterium]
VRVQSDVTMEDETISFAALHLGDHNIVGGARTFVNDETYDRSRTELMDVFTRSAVSETIRLLDEHFTDHSYSLWHLFRDEQRGILDMLLDESLQEIETSIRQIYERHYPVMKAIEGMRMTLPPYFSMVLEFVLNNDIRAALERDELDIDELMDLVEKAQRWPVKIDRSMLNFLASQRLDSLVQYWSEHSREIEPLQILAGALKAFAGLALDPDLWKAQIVYFQVGKRIVEDVRTKAEAGDDRAREWLTLFDDIGSHLRVKIE